MPTKINMLKLNAVHQAQAQYIIHGIDLAMNFPMRQKYEMVIYDLIPYRNQMKVIIDVRLEMDMVMIHRYYMYM